MRAIGYLERDPLPPGPIALITHSGSVFSAMLRTHRRLDYALAVSSGQELVTESLGLPRLRLSARRRPASSGCSSRRCATPRACGPALATAAERDIPVVALTVGDLDPRPDLVDAHSGALAGVGRRLGGAVRGVRRAPASTTSTSSTDSLELFAIGRRVRRPRGGIATVHDSGAERVLVADVAERLGVPFAPLTDLDGRRSGGCSSRASPPPTRSTCGARARERSRSLTGCLLALADDDQVDVVALAVDLVEEYDGDEAFPRALEPAGRRTPTSRSSC